MLAKGLLGEIGLPELLRMINAENLTAVLNIWHRKHGEGVIFVDKGDAMLANVNGRQGQSAIYEMSRWEDATFRLAEQTHLPITQSVTPLLNGAFKTSLASVDPVLRQQLFGRSLLRMTAENMQADLMLETEMIALFSNLENGIQQTQRWLIRRRPETVLKILAQMLNDTIYTGESIVRKGIQSSRVITMAHNIYPNMPLPLLDQNLLLADALQLQYFSMKERGGKNAKTIVPYVCELFESLLLQFTQSFFDPESMTQWQTTSSLLVEELKTALNNVKF